MSSNWEKDYPLESNLSEADLDENSSLKKMLRLVGENKRVIDFGCATGYFAQLLNSKGCEVTGVEVNSKAAKVAEQYCKQVIVADLDFVSLADILPKQTFDVAVFGDVLEHLRDPWKVLNETRQLLKPEGNLIASIPNIAHGAIRLALLQGRFEYMELGILDNTHLRFFTRKTVAELFERSGYSIDVVERTKLSVFEASNLIPSIDKNKFDIKVIEPLEQDEDADTLQFVIKAFPLSLEGKYAALHQQYSKLIEEVENSHSRIQQIQANLEQAETQIQDKDTELERSQSELQHTQAQLERSRFQLQQTQTQLSQSESQLQQTQTQLSQSESQLQQTQTQLSQSESELQYTQAQLEQSQSQLQHTQAELEGEKETITAMRSSKFWKTRTVWFNFKKFMKA